MWCLLDLRDCNVVHSMIVKSPRQEESASTDDKGSKIEWRGEWQVLISFSSEPSTLFECTDWAWMCLCIRRKIFGKPPVSMKMAHYTELPRFAHVLMRCRDHN